MSNDPIDAVEWYRKAAEQGFANAQFNLALMYANGQGAPQDNVDAYAWLSIAAPKVPEAEASRAKLLAEISPEQIASGIKREKELRAQIEAKAGKM